MSFFWFIFFRTVLISNYVLSSNIKLSLETPGYLESFKWCRLSNQDSCNDLMLQTHRSLKTYGVFSYMNVFGVAPEDMQSSKVLASSYGIESCSGTEPEHICFFGNASKDLILLSLVACSRRSIKVYFTNLSDDMLLFMYSIRNSFPAITVQWTTDPFDFWHTSSSLPPCQTWYVENEYLPDLIDNQSQMSKYLPLHHPSTHTGASIHRPQDPPVTLVLSSLLSQEHQLWGGRRADELLLHAFANEDIMLEWRLSTLTYKHNHVDHKMFDSEGFAYRMFPKYREYDEGDLHRVSVGHLHLSPTSTQTSLSRGAAHSRLCIFSGEVSKYRNLAFPDYCDTRVAITYTNRIFRETALGLQQALVAIGISGVEIWGDMHFALGPEYSSGECKLPLQIAIAPHEETMLLPRYVVFHMEQSWSFFLTESRYKHVLKEAQAVWIFSRQHHFVMEQLGVHSSSISLVPMLIDSSFLRTTIGLLASSSPFSPTQTTDIVMMGSSTARRRDFAYSIMHNATLPPYVDIRQVRFEGVVGGAAESYFGDRRDELIRRSKIVVNVHGQESSALEVHRINYLLSLGKCVISEPSSDAELDSQYEDVVVFTAMEHMLPHAMRLLEDESLRRSIEAKAVAFALELVTNTSLIRVAAERLLLV